MDEMEYDLGDGCILRSLREDDVDELYAVTVADQEHLRERMPWAAEIERAHTAQYVSSVLERAARGESLPAVITEHGAIVGSAGFATLDPQHETGSIGYWLIADRVGRGLMTTAVRRLLDHGFGPLKLHRIEIHAAPDNARSRAIPERLGFTQEGVLREGERFPDGYRDLLMYSLLAQEWAG